jgi:Ser/Thr protein kinase RdoA (MazF antagonist)
VPPPVAAAAVRAAVTAAARLGLPGDDPVVLADGANVIVHLRPSPVVAKVAASTAQVRGDSAAWLQRELDLARFLERAGAPVMAASREAPTSVQRTDGHAMSFWTYLEPSGTEPADEATLSSMLRDLHATLRTYPGHLPALAPLNDIAAFLARSRTQLSPADITDLSEALTRLTAELGHAAVVWPALHGDAGRGNLMATRCGWVWHDFEDTCSGPLAWDLAATTVNPRLDRARILGAYGDRVDPGELRTCEQLRRLSLTIWYALYAERLPECRPRAAELLTAWRRPAS